MGISPLKEYMYGSHGIIGRRPTMEDASVIILEYGDNEKYESQAFFGVFDGHNGPRCSRYLARYLPSIIAVDDKFESCPQLAICDAFQRADYEFLKICKSKGIKDGSTAIVTILRRNQLYVANTGI